MSKPRWYEWACIGLAIAAIVWLIGWAPGVLTDWDGIIQGEAPADHARRVSTNRQMSLWMAGGVIAVITLLLTWGRDRSNRAKLDLDRDANYTQRYTEAIAQLGSDSLAIRLGGVYSLERIAADSYRDANVISNVLAAFVRLDGQLLVLAETRSQEARDDLAAAIEEKQRVLAGIPRVGDSMGVDERVSRAEAEVEAAEALTTRGEAGRPEDVTAAIGVLIRLNRGLAGVNLAGADLSETDLSSLDMRHINLRDARLTNANLRDADLRGAILIGTDFRGADLKKASVTHAVIQRVKADPGTSMEQLGASAEQLMKLREDLSP